MAFTITNVSHTQRGSFFRSFGRYLRAMAKHRKDRAEYATLMRMSERDLKDMGLTHGDVREQMMRKVSWPGAV